MYAQLNPMPQESLYHALERWAAAASTHFLRVLLWSGLLGAFGVMLLDVARWPVALGMLALAAGGGWGILEHRLAQGYSRPLRVAELVVAALAVVAAMVTIFVALFVFMGPAPHF